MKAREIASAISARRTTARAQCEAALARIAARNPAMNAMITQRPEV